VHGLALATSSGPKKEEAYVKKAVFDLVGNRLTIITYAGAEYNIRSRN
jgi:hypothetical protein